VGSGVLRWRWRGEGGKGEGRRMERRLGKKERRR
jgi:hypothetical protein